MYQSDKYEYKTNVIKCFEIIEILQNLISLSVKEKYRIIHSFPESSRKITRYVCIFRPMKIKCHRNEMKEKYILLIKFTNSCFLYLLLVIRRQFYLRNQNSATLNRVGKKYSRGKSFNRVICILVLTPFPFNLCSRY